MNAHEHHSAAAQKTWLQTYRPLLVIVGMILLVSNVSADGNLAQLMTTFMAGFFLVFSGFKLLDVHGFAQGYSKYDLLAKHWRGYGYMYPFIELALGLLYLRIPDDATLHLCTLALMIFSGIGVAIKVAKHEKFQCACLGTFIDVPLTTVTLVEDFGMALMAAAMLLI